MQYTIESLLDNIHYITDEKELNMIKKAYGISKQVHQNRKRLSGEPFFIHPFEVAMINIKEKRDAYTIAAALLHDATEEEKVPIDYIEKNVHKTVAFLVNGVTRFSKLDFTNVSDEIISSTRKLLEYLCVDIRVIYIKLADRLHNMRTIEFQSKEKQEKKAKENFEFYIFLANYIGAYDIKCELEDISFEVIDKARYEAVKKLISRIYNENKIILEETKNNISRQLTTCKISHTIQISNKSIYSTYKRLLDNIDPNAMHDVLGLTLIVDDVKDCYIALGVIHSLYSHNGKKLKDYINPPKYNHYQSFHTTISADNVLIQCKTRTKEMDLCARNGFNQISEETLEKDMENLKEKLSFFGTLHKIFEIEDDKECMGQIKRELFTDTIDVYDINGKIIVLPKGATVLDFILRTNPELIKKIGIVTVNEKYKKLNCKLKKSDVVRVMPSDMHKTPKVNLSWLNKCETYHAKQLIKQIIK